MNYDWLFEKIKHIPTQHGINREQAIELYEIAKSSEYPIIEVGAYKGRSTSILGLGSKNGNKVKIYSIDPFTCHGTFKENYKNFLENIEKAGVKDLVYPIPKTSDKAEIPDKVGLLFIDGSHEYKWIKHDLLKFKQNVIDKGYISMHDFHFEGTKKVFDEIIYPNLFKNGKFTNFKLIKSLIVMQKNE